MGWLLLMIAFSAFVFALALLPAGLFMRNLPLFRRLQSATSVGNTPQFSVLIPARDEESAIGGAIDCILANDYANFELVVLDDHSTDQTATIVQERASRDGRVRIIHGNPLPEGWNGKQHACWQLANVAKGDWLVFLDADVRLSKDALSRVASELAFNERDLISGFPKQVTITFGEQLLIPMMHVILLGYLPLDQMRASSKPEFGAGCGQLFITRRSSYFACGGHSGIRQSRHDGLKLPRLFRHHGLSTDVFDGTDIASCRMYHSTRQVIAGLLKNADEGIAQPKLIGLFSILLIGGHVLPVFTLAHALYHRWPWLLTAALLLATVLSYVPRMAAANRFQQSILGAMLHPLAVAAFVGVQWWAFTRKQLGLKPIAWRGRSS